MSVKIRFQRRGRKGRAFYTVVVSDSRSPRNGRFIKKLGIYDPHSDPPSITLDTDATLSWLQKGAKPTKAARSILSKKGVLLRKHLLEGVKKGLFYENEAERRYQEWLNNSK